MTSADANPRSEAARQIKLVARREARSVLASRAFAVGNVVTILLVIGGFALTSLFEPGPIRIGLQGSRPAGAPDVLRAVADNVGEEIEIVEVDADQSAATALSERDLDAVVVDGTEIVVAERDDRTIGIIGTAWAEARLAESLRSVGVDDRVLAEARAPLAVTETTTDPDNDDPGSDGAGFATVLVLFLAIQTAGAYIMMSVMQEKGTRIVELLLASIAARNLLLGKVVGIGLVGLVQIVVLVGSFLAAAALTGRDLPPLGATTLGAGLIFYLVGYLFYGSLYAAGASLAPSQEDAQATLAPISILTLLSYFASVLVSTSPDSTLSQVISYLPPVAPFAFPGRLATGDTSLVAAGIALVLTVLATAAVFTLAGRIYVRSVIHTDRKLGWREAWSMRS